jgi:hypothetical protein
MIGYEIQSRLQETAAMGETEAREQELQPSAASGSDPAEGDDEPPEPPVRAERQRHSMLYCNPADGQLEVVRARKLADR